MKKIILVTSLISLFTSAYAFTICKEKIDLGDKFIESPSWVKNGEFGDKITYQKIEGKEVCTLDVTAKKISKIQKRFMIEDLIKPGVSFDSIEFQYGNILYVKDGVSGEKTFSDGNDFVKEFDKVSKSLRFYKINYANDSKLVNIVTMCQKIGSKCTTVISIEPKVVGVVNERIRKIEEEKNLKLFKTEGWK